MAHNLESKYRNYKTWLKQRHLDDGTWVLNWDLRQNQFAEFGKGDSLFFTAIYLTALAVEGNQEEFAALLSALNKQKYAKGMYPRYRERFDTSKDPYYPLMLALVCGMFAFPQNSLAKESLDDIIHALMENDYRLKNPDGSETTHGDMGAFRPIIACIQGRSSLKYFISLGIMPAYSFILHLVRRSYFNNFMIASQYLIYDICTRGMLARGLLKLSVQGFASVNRRNPYFLMIRDRIAGSRKHQAKVEQILEFFPDDHLPNEGDHITNSDVLWQIDPRDWETPNTEFIHEYSGADYMVLYQFYKKHYRSDEAP